MANTAGSDALTGKRDFDKARQLVKEAGYQGENRDRILLRFAGSIPDGHSPFRDRILRQIGTAVYMQGLTVRR
jgi:hypothetical protein